MANSLKCNNLNILFDNIQNKLSKRKTAKVNSTSLKNLTVRTLT